MMLTNSSPFAPSSTLFPNCTFSENPSLLDWADAWLQYQESQVEPGTMVFYRTKISLLQKFIDTQVPPKHQPYPIEKVDVWFVNAYQAWLQRDIVNKKGENVPWHQPGGVHAALRTLRTMVNWWQSTNQVNTYFNPWTNHLVKMPKVSDAPLDPVDLDDVRKLIEACRKPSWDNTRFTQSTCQFYGVRDEAFFMVLLETGFRISEVLKLELRDYDPRDGSLLVRETKGDVPKWGYLQSDSKKAFSRWLEVRPANADKIFCLADGSPLEYSACRDMIERRCKQADVKEIPTPHDFRRAFCLSMIDDEVPETTIARLMGHANESLIRRYAKQRKLHLAKAAAGHSVVSKALGKNK